MLHDFQAVRCVGRKRGQGSPLWLILQLAYLLDLWWDLGKELNCWACCFLHIWFVLFWWQSTNRISSHTDNMIFTKWYERRAAHRPQRKYTCSLFLSVCNIWPGVWWRRFVMSRSQETQSIAMFPGRLYLCHERLQMRSCTHQHDCCTTVATMMLCDCATTSRARPHSIYLSTTCNSSGLRRSCLAEWRTVKLEGILFNGSTP